MSEKGCISDSRTVGTITQANGAQGKLKKVWHPTLTYAVKCSRKSAHNISLVPKTVGSDTRRQLCVRGVKLRYSTLH